MKNKMKKKLSQQKKSRSSSFSKGCLFKQVSIKNILKYLRSPFSVVGAAASLAKERIGTACSGRRTTWPAHSCKTTFINRSRHLDKVHITQAYPITSTSQHFTEKFCFRPRHILTAQRRCSLNYSKAKWPHRAAEVVLLTATSLWTRAVQRNNISRQW